MASLLVDKLWDLPCVGYHLQARPDQASIERLRALQQEILNASPTALHLIPANALHLSLATLVPAQESGKGEEQWTEIEKEVRVELENLNNRASISITLEHLAYNKNAVVARTEIQPAGLIKIRRNLGTILNSKGIVFPDYDQTHVTVARYAESIELDDAELLLFERNELRLLIDFDPPRLVREIRYPSLEIEDI